MIKAIIKLITAVLIINNISFGAANFYHNENRYRGWYWFEEDQQDPAATSTPMPHQQEISPEIAKAEIEQFAKKLEERKFIMLARPTVENVKAYRELEEQLWQQAFMLEDSWRLANLVHPALHDLTKQPVNVAGVKLKRKIEEEDKSKVIDELAKRFDLVLFFRSDCQYCHEFAPVLQRFGLEHGFNIEAVSADGGELAQFQKAKLRTVELSGMLKKLGIEVFPTVVAVSKRNQTADQGAIELIRGYVSTSELEEYSLLLVKYLQMQQKW